MKTDVRVIGDSSRGSRFNRDLAKKVNEDADRAERKREIEERKRKKVTPRIETRDPIIDNEIPFMPKYKNYQGTLEDIIKNHYISKNENINCGEMFNEHNNIEISYKINSKIEKSKIKENYISNKEIINYGEIIPENYYSNKVIPNFLNTKLKIEKNYVPKKNSKFGKNSNQGGGK